MCFLMILFRFLLTLPFSTVRLPVSVKQIEENLVNISSLDNRNRLQVGEGIISTFQRQANWFFNCGDEEGGGGVGER